MAIAVALAGLAIKKSRPYDITDLGTMAFEFANDALVGIKENVEGVLNQLNPSSDKFDKTAATSEALDAYNIAKYGSNKNAYEDLINISDPDLLNAYFDKEKNKLNNEQFVDPSDTLPSLAFSEPRSTGDSYRRGRKAPNRYGSKEVLAYPLDIDPKQDHMKIRRYNYLRAQANSSKPQRDVIINDQKVNVAGDSVVGSDLMGSILLPMPKATDVNGVEWGKSELTSTGLGAMKLAQGIDRRLMSAAGGAMVGGMVNGPTGATIGGITGAMVDASGLTGTTSGISAEEIRMQNEAREAIQTGDYSLAKELMAGGSGMMAQSISSISGFLLGTELDTDTFLARTGGRVLNPNAEMLFQGPVIRDFTFSFVMIARSEKEGKEIRKIIRFLKLGMAPKFQNNTFIANPDVFLLDYKNGLRENDVLKTVNRFNPGGLALTTMNVDYAPNGYWSAYEDSQPVAVKMDLNFTELRPLYQGDQLGTPEDSVGY